MSFVCSPNLPCGRVTLAAVSAGAVHMISWLKQHGIKPIELPDDVRLAGPVRSHADLLLHHLGGGNLIMADTQSTTAQRLRAHGFSIQPMKRMLSAEYPGDVPLCALRMGDFLFAKLSTLDSAVETWCRKQKIQLIDCAQGYARCSGLILSKKAAVTADPSLARAMECTGIEVLKIRPGHIRLPGYSYGFLGGCCGLIAPDTLVCNGSLNTHPDGERIAAFAFRHSVRIISVHPEELTDIGGILPLEDDLI